jgi:hypothetical protein
MIKKIAWKWEEICSGTWRAKVIGGWLVLHTGHTTITDGKKRDIVQSESMVFVSDRDHEWQIVEPIVEKAVEKAKVVASDFESSK